MSMKNPVGLRLMMFMVCVVSQVVHGEQQIRCLPKEREALLQFKTAIVDRYDMLSSWTTPDCCQWEGIRCSNLTAHIISLDLHGGPHVEHDEYEETSSRYLSGEIHTSLMELQHLEYLNLSHNSFSIGPSVPILSRNYLPLPFPYMNISSNYFRGSQIPEFLGSLKNLKYLDLSSSGFGGEISIQLGSLSNLKYLNLAHNFLEGFIPPQLGNLSQLQELYLEGNPFEGNVASQLGNLSRLQVLFLGSSSFEGNGPSPLPRYHALKIDDGGQWLSNLISLNHLYLEFRPNPNTSHSWLQMIAKLPKLRELSLVGGTLSDHFILSSTPSKFNFSTSLSVLHLSGNAFTSPMVFEWVSNITSNLVELDLSGNLLEGSTSSDFGMVMNSLRHLDLSYNYFKARDFKSFINLCTLHSLKMRQNNLTEDLSSILSNLSSGCVRHSLQQLDLSSNQITGTLSELSVFSSLKALVLDENDFSGKIPQDIILPPQLKSLSIRGNSLKGGIPKSFGSACVLSLLDMSSNSLTEEFSMIIDHLSGCVRNSLQELNLAGNKINGTLPDLSIFLALKTLDLSQNQLSGKISEGSKLPSKLEHLSIQSNTLEGGIPKSFGNACALRSLDMSDNNLSEEFPVIIHNLLGCSRNSLQELMLEENKIKGTLPDLSLFSTLQVLDLSKNALNGKIPEGNKLPPKLQHLSIRSNTLDGGIPNSFRTACSLLSFDMFNNSFSDELPLIIHPLCECARYSLKELNLGMNQITGTLPDFSIFTSLKRLYLFENKLNGEIPKDIQFPPQLEELQMHSNSLTGVFTDYHFTDMPKLQELLLSDNSLALAFTQTWIPPFQLLKIELRSCKLGPTFPKWLHTQNKFVNIDISNAAISDIVPEWFWAKLPLQEVMTINISYNNLRGIIPNFPPTYIPTSMSVRSNLKVLFLHFFGILNTLIYQKINSQMLFHFYVEMLQLQFKLYPI